MKPKEVEECLRHLYDRIKTLEARVTKSQKKLQFHTEDKKVHKR